MFSRFGNSMKHGFTAMWTTPQHIQSLNVAAMSAGTVGSAIGAYRGYQSDSAFGGGVSGAVLGALFDPLGAAVGVGGVAGYAGYKSWSLGRRM